MAKDKKYTVKFGKNTETTFLKPMLKEIDSVTRVNHLFTADSVTLEQYIACDYSSDLLRNKYKKFIRKELESAFGCKFEDEWFKMTLLEACLQIKLNRKIDPVNYTPNKFLGIEAVVDEEGSSWKLDYAFFMRDHVDYQTGWLKGKKDEKLDKIKKELEEMREKVYGQPLGGRWAVLTVEGDKVICKNLYEVTCFIQARGSNYSGTGKKQDW